MGSGSPSKPVQFGEAAFSLAQTGLRWLRPAPWAPSQDWPSRRGAGGASFKLRRPNALHSILALPNYAGPLVLGPARARQGWPSHRGARGRKVLSILGVSGHFPSTRHPSQPRRPVPSEPPGPRALLSTGPGSDPARALLGTFILILIIKFWRSANPFSVFWRSSCYSSHWSICPSHIKKSGGSPQLYYHDVSGRIPGHTTRHR